MELLNLDELVTPKRTITLRGVKHDVLDMTVLGFIKTSRAIKALVDKEDADTAEQLELSMDSITETVPTMTRDILQTLTLEQLGKINRFLRGEFDDKTVPVAPEGDEGGAEKK